MNTAFNELKPHLLQTIQSTVDAKTTGMHAIAVSTVSAGAVGAASWSWSEALSIAAMVVGIAASVCVIGVQILTGIQKWREIKRDSKKD